MRAVISLLILAVALTAGACRDGDGRPGASSDARRLPLRPPEQVAYDLLDDLLVAPIAGELPPGFHFVEPTPAPPKSQPGAAAFEISAQARGLGGLGGVVVRLDGPGEADLFSYVAFPTGEAARTYFELALPVSVVNEPSTPDGFDVPARCAVGNETQFNVGAAACRVLAGTIVIESYAAMPNGVPRGDLESAVALARLSRRHLAEVMDSRTLVPAGTAKAQRIGWLSVYGHHSAWWTRLLVWEQLSERGKVRGRDYVVDYRFADLRGERLPELAAELVHAGVDLIVTFEGYAPARAAMSATSDIPIVMLIGGNDPLEDGLIASYAQPGGNITGSVAAAPPEIFGKRLEIVKEALPHVRRVAVLLSPRAMEHPRWRSVQETGTTLGMEIIPVVVERPTDVDSVLRS
jgi:hypothetical protein